MSTIIGLIGCTGSGKTTVAKELTRLGAYSIDADIVSREALLPKSQLVKAVVRALGSQVLLAPGIINRRALSRLIFSDPEKLKVFNAIMHPYIRSSMLERAQNAIRIYNKQIIVLDAPLLIEAGMKDDVDDIWLITAPVEARKNRLRARDAIDENDIINRIESRIGDDKLSPYADVIIDNSGDIPELIRDVDRIFKERYLKK